MIVAKDVHQYAAMEAEVMCPIYLNASSWGNCVFLLSGLLGQLEELWGGELSNLQGYCGEDCSAAVGIPTVEEEKQNASHFVSGRPFF